ncbi:transporter [Frigoribacterium sp. 2-23]|uniref:transporter n=1 Tax=Frigoribacterium sp. 2-23 TaxID=3415006 RepID=UPI003C6F38A2
MVAHLLRLRLRVMGNTLMRNKWQLVGVIVGALYGLGIMTAVIAGLIALAFAPEKWAWTVAVLGGSVTVLGWLIVPLVTHGIDQTLSVAKLRGFPIPPRRLLVTLLVCGVLGIPGIVTALAALATALSWIRHPLSALVAIVCAALAVLTCVAGSRAFESFSSALGSKRRYREVMSVAIFVPLFLAGPIFLLAGSGLATIGGDLPHIARVLSWSPLGAVWSAPGDLALGRPLEALAKFGIALVVLAALLALWGRSIRVSLVTPPSSGGAATAKGLGAFRWFPATPTGAVAARALTYWLRDPRYGGSLIVLPLLPVLAIFLSVTGGSTWTLLAIGPAIAALLAITLSADVSYDGTAFAAHLSTGLPGAADRGGRVLAMAIWAVPVVIVATVTPVAVLGDWVRLPALLGVSLGVLLTGFGVSSILSARILTPVPKSGESPFKTPPGGGLSTTLLSLGGWAAVFVVSLPELVLAVFSLIYSDVLLGLISVLVGLALGVAATIVGIRQGGRLLDRRGPELLAQLQRGVGA